MTSPAAPYPTGSSEPPLILWKSAEGGNWSIPVRRFRRPRCGMPTMMCSTPATEHQSSMARGPGPCSRTLGRGREERVERGEHRLPALEAVPLQARELELEELVEHLGLREQLVYAPLVLPAPAPHPICPGLALGLGFEEVREPQPLGLARGVHVLVRDAADVHVAQVARDPIERPVLGAGVLADGARPDDAVDVVRARRVPEPVAFRGERADLVALEEVERVDARGAVPVRAEGVDVAEQGGVRRAVFELGGGIWEAGCELCSAPPYPTLLGLPPRACDCALAHPPLRCSARE